MNNHKHTLTATVGFVLARGTKIHEAKTLEEAKEDAADILDAMHHLIKEFDLSQKFCYECGYSNDRDENAVLNLLALVK